MTRTFTKHSLLIRLSQALVCALLLGAASSSALAQVPNLRFSTSGSTSYGDASSSDGAWRGAIKFQFNGTIAGSPGSQHLDVVDLEIKLPATPSGTRFYWLKDKSTYAVINRGGTYPAVTFSSDATFDTLTIANLPAYEDYSNNASARWDGRMKVTLRFSKVRGVADRFRVEFAPTTPQFNPPPSVSGLIASATVDTRTSDLILQR